MGELSIAPAYFIYRYHSLQLFTPASFAGSRVDWGLPHHPSRRRRRFQKRDVNLLAAELQSLFATIHEDIYFVPFDAATLVRHGVNAGIFTGAHDLNPRAHRENPGIRGDSGSSFRLGAFRGHTLARIRESQELFGFGTHRTQRMLVLVAFTGRKRRQGEAECH
jgi:hypothetical protein